MEVRNLVNRESVEQFLYKVLTNKGLMVVAVLAIIVASVVVYQLDIGWRGQVEKWGYFGVFFLMLVGSMTILFPLPFEAILATTPGIMGVAGVELFWLGLVASIGGAFGEVTAYFAGLWGRVAITGKYREGYSKVENGMRRFGGPAIFVFALTPLPFDLVGLAAGTLRFQLGKFVLYCWAGRLVRSLIIVYLGWIGWDSIQKLFSGAGC
ncbi:MAG: YqaA family protein [Dehalococcoidia bacterium]